MDAFNDPKAGDHQKAEVVENARRHWRSIEDELRKFFAEKWTAWEQEKPKFFTKAWIAKLHDDMLPERVRTERRGEEEAADGEAVLRRCYWGRKKTGRKTRVRKMRVM